MIASMATNPSLRVIPFKGTELAPGAEGRVLIAGDQMLMVAAHLPAPPQNRTYQVWLVRSKAPAIASAGTFNPDAGSNATLQFGNRELLNQVTAVAVTDEPVGGSAQPTGHKWVIGVGSGL
jgi:anti-sigma-K factor RskA